jgi:hypothetical protein
MNCNKTESKSFLIQLLSFKNTNTFDIYPDVSTFVRKVRNNMTDKIHRFKDLIHSTLEKERIWDLSDKVLYDMCKNHPFHDNPKEIIMKTLIIGRVYSVQLERRKNKDHLIGDRFYEDMVIPTFMKSRLDEKLINLRTENLKPSVFNDVFSVHKSLMDSLHKITEMDKRSFCSKYLHFHLPKLFFLYDSRLCQSVSILSGKITKEQKETFINTRKNYDITYVEFFLKCYNLKEELQNYLNRPLKIRDFDNIMIEISNCENQKKKQQV